jgi:hypothetical protein
MTPLELTAYQAAQPLGSDVTRIRRMIARI